MLITACKSNYIITKNIELDSKNDLYVSQKILSDGAENYEIFATIKFNESYRKNKKSWAGFLLKTNVNNGLHGKDSGYMFYIRENGEIGVHSSPQSNNEIELTKYLRSLEYGEKINVKILSTDNQLKIYVNGKEQFAINDMKLKGKYISANAGGADVSIKINSFKKM